MRKSISSIEVATRADNAFRGPSTPLFAQSTRMKRDERACTLKKVYVSVAREHSDDIRGKRVVTKRRRAEGEVAPNAFLASEKSIHNGRIPRGGPLSPCDVLTVCEPLNSLGLFTEDTRAAR